MLHQDTHKLVVGDSDTLEAKISSKPLGGDLENVVQAFITKKWEDRMRLDEMIKKSTSNHMEDVAIYQPEIYYF